MLLQRLLDTLRPSRAVPQQPHQSLCAVVHCHSGRLGMRRSLALEDAQHQAAIGAARAAGARRILYTSHMAASASSFSFCEMSLANSVASAIAFSTCGFTSAGRPSQNFLFTITA